MKAATNYNSADYNNTGCVVYVMLLCFCAVVLLVVEVFGAFEASKNEVVLELVVYDKVRA